MKYCIQCGKPMNDNAAFCAACGARQSAAPAPMRPAGQTGEQVPRQTPGQPVEPQKKKSHAGLIIGIIAGSLTLTAGIVVLVMSLITVPGSKLSAPAVQIPKPEQAPAAAMTPEEFESKYASAIAEVYEPKAAEETDAAPAYAAAEAGDAAGVYPFEGTWVVSDRYGLSIERSGETYSVSMHASNSAWSGFDAEMTCRLEDGALVYDDGMIRQYRYSWDPEAPLEEASIRTENLCGRFYLSMTEDETGYDGDRTVFRCSDSDDSPRLVWEETTRKKAEDEYILWFSSQIWLTENDVTGMSAEELWLARQEIPARRGCVFEDSATQAYFEGLSWYQPQVGEADFDYSSLSETEQINCSRLNQWELALSGQMVPPLLVPSDLSADEIESVLDRSFSSCAYIWQVENGDAFLDEVMRKVGYQQYLVTYLYDEAGCLIGAQLEIDGNRYTYYYSAGAQGYSLIFRIGPDGEQYNPKTNEFMEQILLRGYLQWAENGVR